MRKNIIEQALGKHGLDVIEIFRDENIFDPNRSNIIVKQDDILLVKGSAEDIISGICTHILSNNATAVLLLPIAISTATSLEVAPRPFIIGICFGASACYATPIGYQTNLLVYGPGRYR